MASHSAYISVGSNIGDKLVNCQNGIAALTLHHGTSIEEQSAFYKTEPVDFKDQDWFINAVVRISTDIEPVPLLKSLNSIQREAGRETDVIRFGPRILDLDIIFYDELVMNSPELVIPHPRMHERRFVLKPLCDINPGMIHPVFGKSVETMLNALDGKSQQVFKYKS